MRKIIVSEFVTADGVMEGPGPDPGFARSGWAFKLKRGEEGDQYKLGEVMGAGALLIGRVTYESFASAWPNMPRDSAGFADKMNSMPKYVVSSTLRETTWNNASILRGELAREIAKLKDLKEQQGGYLLVNGSARLVQTLTEHGLVDEYRLMVFPMLLGDGKRLFGKLRDPSTLRLTGARSIGPDGIVLLTYESSR
jgi:dihydrofolate reductase